MILDVHQQFRVATTTHVGMGISANLLQEVQTIGAKRITFVTDPGVRRTGMVDRLIQPLIEVVQGVGEIPAEISDFQTEEAVEILAAVSAELVVDNEKAKKIVLASLDLVSSSVPKVAALVEAIKS